MLRLQKPATLSYLSLIVVYLVWGTTFCAIRFGVDSIPPQLFLCLRFLIAGILLLGGCLLSGQRLPALKTWGAQALIGILMLFLGNSVVCWAVQHIPTGLGAMLMATTPFWMMGLSAVIPPRERIQPLALLGMLLGFLGLVTLFLPQMQHGATDATLSYWLSAAAVMAMAFFWALGSILAKRLPEDPHTSLWMAIGIQNLTVGLLFVPLCFILPGSFAVVPSVSSLAGLTYLILASSVVATACYLHVLKSLPVSIASTFAYVTPVITITIGVVFLHESFSPAMLAGMALTLMGVVLIQIRPLLPRLLRIFQVFSSSLYPSHNLKGTSL